MFEVRFGASRVRQRSKNREAFEYEPTYSIFGTGSLQLFCILKQRSCILGKTFGSSLGCYSATADCWLWFHGAWLRETVQGVRSLRRHPAYDGRARASSHGMAHHSDRTHRRSRRPAWSFRPTCKFADGCGSLGSDANCPSPLWVQLDQAAECDGRPGTVRAAGVRACSALSCRACG